MDDLKRWQSLDRLCKDMLAISFKLEDSIRLASQLVLQLELAVTSTSNGKLAYLENRSENLNEDWV